MGIGLDSEIHADIKAGDWSGALNHSSYHLPFVGAGRNSWDAWQTGHPWQAAGHAGLLGVEAFGLRGAGRVRGENSFFTDANYTKKVLGQIKSQDFHAFPESVAAFEKMGTVTVIKSRVCAITWLIFSHLVANITRCIQD